MFCRQISFLWLLFPAFIAAQDNSVQIPKSSYTQIFNQYYLPQKEFVGIMDSTDSYFCVFQDTIIQSPFDSICFRNEGKTWHRNQLMDCKTYLVVNELYPYQWKGFEDSIDIDTAIINTQARLKKIHKQLWVCFGEFFMNEDSKAEYSGRFTGSFQIYFLFDTSNKSILVCTNNTLPPNEPSVFFYGYWKPFIHTELANLPYFWASTLHKPIENNGTLLPDLRIQPDGSQSFTNIVEFSGNCMKPIPNWYNKIQGNPVPKNSN